MSLFILALGVMLAGGVLSLVTYKKFVLMKTISLVFTTMGSLIGLFSLLVYFRDPEIATVSWSWLHTFDISLKMDSVSAFFQLLIFIIAPVATLYSFHYMDDAKNAARTAINYFFFAILNVSMALVTVANNIITFALVWEIMSLSSFFLVVYKYNASENRKAGLLYFIFCQGGALFLFAAFAVLYSHTGSFSFDQVAQIPATAKLIVFIFALIGFGSKAGIFPLHIWLPHAHPAAPSHISAVMSGVMIKMGIFGIIRMYGLLGDSSAIYGQIILIAGATSGVLGVVYALGKHDIKKLLAYHSVENIGIILIGAGVGMLGVSMGNNTVAAFGFAGSFLHVLNHSIFKSLLFMGAGAILQKTGTRKIDQLGGLGKRMPITGKTFLIGSVSISGLPPFNGFVSEFLIYYAAFHGLMQSGSSFLLMILAIVSLAVIGGLALACFTKVVGVAFLGEPRSENAASASEVGITMTSSMIFLAASCILIGVWPEPFVRLAFMGFADLNLVGVVPINGFVGLIRNITLTSGFFIGLVVAVAGLRKLLIRNKQIDQGPTWGCGFTKPTVRMQYTGTSYAMSIIDFYRPFVVVKSAYSGIKKIFPGQTKYSTHVDDIAEVNMRNKLVMPLLGSLRRLLWIQNGNIQLYISYIVLTIIAMLIFA
jgi:hydrogenase-4 component B